MCSQWNGSWRDAVIRCLQSSVHCMEESVLWREEACCRRDCMIQGLIGGSGHEWDKTHLDYIKLTSFLSDEWCRLFLARWGSRRTPAQTRHIWQRCLCKVVQEPFSFEWCDWWTIPAAIYFFFFAFTGTRAISLQLWASQRVYLNQLHWRQRAKDSSGVYKTG